MPQVEFDKQPLLSVEELESAKGVSGELLDVLRARSYWKLGRVPGVRSPAAFPREPLNLYKFLMGREQLFNSTALNPLYRKVYLGRDLSLLDDLFFRGAALDRETVAELLGDALTEKAFAARILVADGSRLRSLLRVTPVFDWLLFSDRPDHRQSGSEPVWLGGDSMRLANFLEAELAGRRRSKTLDLCSGGGIQSFTLGRHAESALGMDLNPRAVAMATLNTQLNGIRGVDFAVGNVVSDLDGKYDVIVSNAPFVAMPETAREGNLDGHGGQYGLDLTLALCEAVPSHLEDGGCWYMLTTSPTVKGEDLLVRELTEIAARKHLDVTLEPLQYTFTPHNAKHRLKLGIEYTTNYIATVYNADRGALKRLPLPALRSLVYHTQVRLARRKVST